MDLHQAITSFILSFLIASCMSEQWNRVEHLDRQKKFRLSWNITESHVVFELLVNTTGWIGIGISPNGGMAKADIHVGWVKDGNVFLTDRFGGDFNGFPPLDDGQDLVLIEGWECDGQTSITFKRQLAACDPEQDRPITKNTIRLIFAYHDVDPDEGELMPQDIHTVRGVKSLLLFEKEKEMSNFEEDEISSFSVLNDGSEMSRASTYYHCRIVEIPALKSKHHVIKIAPVIEERNTQYIHHMTISSCPPKLSDPSQVGRGGDCYGGTLAEYRQCLPVMAGWAVGSGAMMFPEDVGFPIGLPGQSRYVSLTIHYSNYFNEDIRDHSGFKFIYTSQLRKHDAGMTVLSHHLAGYNLVVPPNSPSFDIHAVCGSECIGGAMDVAKVSSINVIGAFLHTHLAGRKIYFRHFRNGTELAPISYDDDYDYDFQETRTISPSREVLNGDALGVTCTYSTAGKSKLVEGGLGTYEEMCAAFFYFYPYTPLSICSSAPNNSISTINKILGVKSVKPVGASPIYLLNRFRNLMITSPDSMTNQSLEAAINNFDWTEESRKSLSRGFADDNLHQMCRMARVSKVPVESVIDPLGEIQPHVDSVPKPVCVKNPHNSSPSHLAESCSLTSQ